VVEELSRWEDEGGPPRPRRIGTASSSARFADLDSTVRKLRGGKPAYRELFRSADLSTGVYVLPPGAIDDQSPHSEDEVYYVVRGRGAFEIEGERRQISPGEILFVPANRVHRFHEVSEELVALVVFGPAEYTRSGRSEPR